MLTYSIGDWEIYRRFQGVFFRWKGGGTQEYISVVEFFTGKRFFQWGGGGLISEHYLIKNDQKLN